MLMAGIPKSRRTRGGYGRKSNRENRHGLDELLGASKFCHVGYVLDGAPIVAPTLCWRDGDRVYVLVPGAKRILENARFGLNVCLSVSAEDGKPRARPAHRHPVHYREATLFGRAQVVSSTATKLELLHAILERSFPSLGEALLSPSVKEIKATIILALQIDDASITVRTGHPEHDAGVDRFPAWIDRIFAASLAKRPDKEARNPSKAKPLPNTYRARPPANGTHCFDARPRGALSVSLPS